MRSAQACFPREIRNGCIINMAEIQQSCCNLCSFRCKEKLDLTKHMFGAHSVECTFKFRCGINECLHTFHSGTTFTSFKTHADRKHPRWKETFKTQLPIPVHHSSPPAPSLNVDPIQEGLMDINATHMHDIDQACDEISHIPSSQRSAAIFLLTLKEKYNISQKAIDFAVGSMTTIMDNMCDSIKESVQKSLEPHLQETDISGLINHVDPFSCLQTEYQQAKFYHKEFGLVVSLVAIIGNYDHYSWN